jgi:uncharacterized membrane protein
MMTMMFMVPSMVPFMVAVVLVVLMVLMVLVVTVMIMVVMVVVSTMIYMGSMEISSLGPLHLDLFPIQKMVSQIVCKIVKP